MVRNSAGSVPVLAPVLVLDFDGTVCIGDAPVLAYAEAVIDAIPANAPRRDETVAGIRSHLEMFLAGTADARAYVDGYAAVAALAAGHVTSEQLDRAYLTSRSRLAAGELEVSTPPGLADFLASLEAERVLVTNAPADGVAQTLAVLGLTEVIDRVVTDAGKPAGWASLIPQLLNGRRADQLMSVGDIWRNDLAEPAEAGCATALVDRFGNHAGTADLAAPRLQDLFGGIRDWAADPAAFADAHSDSPSANAHLTYEGTR